MFSAKTYDNCKKRRRLSMDPGYKSVNRFDPDATLDEDKHGQLKKSKVDPPRSSNISNTSSEDFFHLDPKLLPRFTNVKPQEKGQSPIRNDQRGLTRDISFKSDDNDAWSQGCNSPISDITSESMLQTMSPTRSPPVQVMERYRDNSKYDPNRIPASAFTSKSSAPVEWSTNSNDSLFSIRLGNGSMSRDHARKVHGDLHKHEDSHRGVDPLKFRKPFPAMERKSDYKISDVDNKSGSDEPKMSVPKETIDPSELRFSPIEISFSAPAPVRRSDGSELDAEDFVGPIKKGGCTMCNCTNCRLTMCACAWPSPGCCSCGWPSCCSCKGCCSCKWPSCSSCKWSNCCSCKCLSCSSCKWSSCCSCKWPSCCSCKWPSCCSCKWSSCCSCKWPSCCSCKLPSCSSCKLSSCCCCPCKWPSCCSCGWPSCPTCSLKCFKCSNCACGCPSCTSCSLFCCSWPSCKCLSCSWPSCNCSSCSWPSCNCSSCSWPSVCCWKCKPRKLFCCFSKVSPEDKIRSDHHKRTSNKRSRCCHFPCFSWSWFSCRCS